jgi:hypothetical protein
MGKNPRRFPMPAFLFARFGFAGRDLSRMWRWLRDGELPVTAEETRSIQPAALTVEEWLSRQKSLTAASPPS